jgi:lipopolysaccharide transport system ATP-binding protein
MTRPAIRVANIAKRYSIGVQRQGNSLREAINETLTWPLKAVQRRLGTRPPAPSNTFWALQDVSFEVQPGEAIGLIGPNGSGKSTLLKILARITRPTVGYFEMVGRLGALLEIGTGFHPELTGRENIFFNGSFLGMKRAEIMTKFDSIVAFSGTDKFIDTPVKFYSSGMYVRLAFSVAAHLDTDILLLDEVLAVGDMEFQRKAQAKLHAIANDGRTVILVTHVMQSIRELCTRVIWLQNGQICGAGEPEEVIAAYTENVNKYAS